MQNIARLWRTLKYLKIRQVYFRLYYVARNLIWPLNGRDLLKGKVVKLKKSAGNTIDFIPAPLIYISPSTFTFLNLEHKFSGQINWNYAGKNKLWTYNLNYFDFLSQESLTKEDGLRLIHLYLIALPELKDGLEPYSVSLRIINWVKFCLKYNVEDKQINLAIHGHTILLSHNLEYHLLANHLLENSFALCIGAIYSVDEKLLARGRHLLEKELKEQIQPDGAHYERSGMYHQILLCRLLDLINISSIFPEQAQWVKQLKPLAEKMLGWIIQFSFNSLHLPLFNDSAFGIAPDTDQLLKYGRKLELNPYQILLKESGFRKFTGPGWELLTDVGNITPKYQPGHTHAGTFSFELYIKGQPVIVDTGTSTYTFGERRLLERKTKAHNTVTIVDTNSSEVWASHRIGQRASVSLRRDEPSYIEAEHDGYRKFNLTHSRIFQNNVEDILIVDKVLYHNSKKESSQDASKLLATARFHFHPSIAPKLEQDGIMIENLLLIQLKGQKAIRLLDYFYAPEFNTLLPAKVCEIDFVGKLNTILKIIDFCD